jgi:MFS transporter, OFA family, oxalate/formate antiporter
MHASNAAEPSIRSPRPPKPFARWLIALAGAWLQLFLGTVYAWSYFQNPLADAYGWTNSQVIWAFSFAICFLGLAAAWGGTLLPRFGPRKLAAIGGVLFGGGYLLAAAALHWHSLFLLYLGYGVVGGSGLGLGYVTPVATVAKWFPDRKGLATGLVIMGFGFGALLMSKVIAPTLYDWSGGNLVGVFLWLGGCFTVATLLGASVLRNPPPGYAPPQWAGMKGQGGALQPSARRNSTPIAATVGIVSPQFTLMWTIFFCNIVAGISIIGFQSPIFQDLWHRVDADLSAKALASYGATLIAVSALFNGVGRMFWGGLSDRIGRLQAFRFMLASQLAAFALLIFTDSPWLFGGLICYVLLCYGGGFGTMPSFVLDVFGAGRMAQAYGVILTAWSAAGIVGPQIVAYLKDHCGSRAATYSFSVGIGFLAVGLALSLVMRTQRSVEE